MGPSFVCSPAMKVHQTPSRQVSFDVLAADYGAIHFQDVLGDFIAQINNPGATASTLHIYSYDTLISFL